jgi:hypothetical protein
VAVDRSGGSALALVDGLLDRLSLRRTRALIRGRFAVALAAVIGLAYGLAALLVGAMLVLGPTGAVGTTVELLRSPHAAQWWNYPAFVVIAPQVVLVLPFLATGAMLLVAGGVGLGMGAGVILGIRVFRARRSAPAGAASSLSGLAPGLFVLLTLGACCSTSAAAFAGIGAIAQSGGTNVYALLANSWYLSLFQVAILWVALVAQEELVRIYGSLSGTASLSAVGPSARPLGTRLAALGARGFLVVAGSLWALAWLIEFALPPPGAPGGAVFLGGLLLHGGLGLAMVGVGLFPGGVRSFARTGAAGVLGRPLRALLLLVGASVAVGLPPPLAGWGLDGLANVILGALGAPGAVGGAPGIAGPSAAVAVAWAVVYALLGLAAIATALRPGPVIETLAGPEGAAVAAEGMVPVVGPPAVAEPAVRDERQPA